MDIQISPGKLSGVVTAPSSKSHAHRGLICASIASGSSFMENMGTNDDIVATRAGVAALGALCTDLEGGLQVEGIKNTPSTVIINAKESGSTLRFFAPLVSALGVTASFQGEGRLPQRPMEPLLSLLQDHGVSISHKEGEIYSAHGQLTSGRYQLAGNISSQYITGLLLALPLLQGDSEIIITTPLESSRYVDMTLEVQSQFGVEIIKTVKGYKIKGNQQYKGMNFKAEGDYSGAAFWLGAGALGHDIQIKGLSPSSLQADRGILQVLVDLGAQIIQEKDRTKVIKQTPKGTIIDATEIPDSIPILAAVAASSPGTTRVINGERLRIKESDRLESTQVGLAQLGVDIRQTSDGLLIKGGHPLKGGVVDSYADHRIAMALSIAALGASQPVTVLGAQCVEKSYPDFYKDFKKLGGIVHVL